jgi:hypothetical protein
MAEQPSSGLSIVGPRVGATVRPLARYRASLQGRPIDVRATDFNPYEQDVLERWKAAMMPARTTAGPDEIALRLLASRPSLRSAKGKATYAALRDLKHIDDFADEVAMMLVRDFGTRHLARTYFLYNGHATETMFPLFPTLHLLGIKGASMVSAPNSGCGAMHRIMEMQLKPHQQAVRVEAFRNHASDKARHDAAALAKIRELAEKAAASGDILVIDKGGLLAKHLDPRMMTLIRNGTIRFIVHNRDDVDALAGLEGEAYMIDVATSRMKAIEARIIGEHYGLLGKREAAKAWGPAESATRFVIGFGLIGRSIAKGLVRDGAPPESIVIVESDKRNRRKARRLGFSVRTPEEDASCRPSKAVVYIATPETGFTGKDVHKFGKETIVLAATSGGKGIDLASIRGRLKEPTDENIPFVRLGASGPSLNVPGNFNDRSFRLGGGPGGEETRLTVILDGYPLNLFDKSWPDRSAMTSAVVAVAVAEAAALDRPGLHRMNPSRQKEAIARFVARGMLGPRPLDPPLVTSSPFRVMLRFR